MMLISVRYYLQNWASQGFGWFVI